MMLDDRARLNEGCCAKWREINLGDNDVDAAWIATKERQTRTIDDDHVVMPLPRSWWRLLGRAMCSCSPAQGREPAELAGWTRQVKARLGVAVTPRALRRTSEPCWASSARRRTSAWLRWPHVRGDVTTSAIAF
jgi:hypothetical protein